MHKVFVDTDVILDLLMEREPFQKAAVELFRQIELKNIKGISYVFWTSRGIDKCIQSAF